MRYMVLVKATAATEAGVLPDSKLLESMGKFNEELANAGVLLAGEGLQPSSKGARLKFSGERPAVTDGPFTETKELIAGFWIINAKSLDEAIEWMARSPFEIGQEIEIRKIYEAEDFGPALTPEMREQEERLRAKAGAGEKREPV
jgi:hypothetical protein